MALPPLASADDLGSFVGGITSERRGQAEAFLRAASTLVRSKSGRNWVDENGDLVTDLPDAIEQVTIQAAARLWFNPEAANRYAIDEFSTGWSDVGLFLTDAEIEMLQGTVNDGAFTGISSVRVVAPAAASASRLLYGGYFELDDEDELGS